MAPFAPHPVRATLLAAALVWLSPRAVRAEEAIRYKYQDYREAAGRIAVQVHGATVEKDLGTDTRLKVEGVVDAIAGATPTGEPAPTGSDQVPLAQLTERRRAWNATVARQFSVGALTLGAGRSLESDYDSVGWSINGLADFNQKNTTLLAGLAGTADEVRVFFQRPWADKRTRDAILGVTQLLDPRTSVTLNLSWGRQRGYLADPYKLVARTVEIFPGLSLPLTFAENRPDVRDKRLALAALNRAFPELRGALEASYRHQRDSYGVRAHTVDLAWFQQLGDRVLFRPGYRFHDQSAARFYRYRFDGTSVLPTEGPPRPQGPFYSSDYRLSSLQTHTYGFKVIWDVTTALQLDAAYERYSMHGRDGATPKSAYCRADILTVGARYSW